MNGLTFMDLDGRTNRLGYLGYFACALVLTALFSIPFILWMENVSLIWGAVFSLVIMVPAGIRRLHDLGWSAGWIVLSFVPYVAAILFLLLLLLPGSRGANDYGPKPGTKERVLSNID